MSNKRRTKKKTKATEVEKAQQQRLLGAGLIVLAVLCFFSLISFEMGWLGIAFRFLFNFLFGVSGKVFALAMGLIGVLLISNLQSQVKTRCLTSILLFSFINLVYTDINTLHRFTFDHQISFYLNSPRDAGVLGHFFSSAFLSLFGRLGTLILLGFLGLISVFILIHPKKWKELAIQMGQWISQLIQKFKNRAHDKKAVEEKKVQPKPKKKTMPSQKPFEVEIRDYRPKSATEPTDTQVDIPSEPAPASEQVQVKATPLNQDEKEAFTKEIKNEEMEEKYHYPPLSLLKKVSSSEGVSDELMRKNGRIIEETMANFNIDSRITAINRGPTITCYELEPAPGIKLNRIVALQDNLALSLASSDIRIEAPIPGKRAVGIEVPNHVKDSVSLREMIDSEEFKTLDSNVPLALGKDVSGETIISTIDKMPHLLIAGATGSGKSVCINVILTSILYKSSPKDVKLILIDPKVVELSIYNTIPHLLIPVVTDPKKAAFALSWAVDEMEKRYKLFAEEMVRDITSYNEKIESQGDPTKTTLPKIMIVVDELSDLMMVSANEVEDYITRLAQMARAAGIHLILATQRPSVDVITGTIKANIPSRIAFSVSSQIDSRTILDMSGAEKLLGKGDMLFYQGVYSKPKRIQGAFVSDEEVDKIIKYVSEGHEEETQFNEEVLDAIETKKNTPLVETDELLEEAIHLVLTQNQASISFLQRRLKVGYARAARMVDQMEEMGVIGPHEGSKPRKLLWSDEEIDAYLKGENN